MICFDVFLNGEKLCRAGRQELDVMSTHVDYVDTQFDNDDPLTLSVGGLYVHPTRGNVYPNWIPRKRIEMGDEVTFRIVESETADAPVEESFSEPGEREKQERKYYEFLRAKYEGEKDTLKNTEYPQRIPELLDVATVWIDEAAEMAATLDIDLRGKVLKELGIALGALMLARSASDSPPSEGGVAADGVVLSSETPEPDGPMSPEQQARVDQLTEEEIAAIDDALLSNASHQFRKVARVVGTTMMKSPPHHQGIADLFYAQRIRHLVATGKLESQGDLNSMRFSEVRVPR